MVSPSNDDDQQQQQSTSQLRQSSAPLFSRRHIPTMPGGSAQTNRIVGTDNLFKSSTTSELQPTVNRDVEILTMEDVD